MPLWSLTLEKVQKLLKEREDKEAELNVLIGTATKTLWERDLEAFLVALEDWYAEEEAIEQEGKSVKRVKGKKPSKPRKPAARKKKDDSDEEDFGTKKTLKKEAKPVTIKKEDKPTTIKKEDAAIKKEDKPVTIKKEDKLAKKPAKTSTIESFFSKKKSESDDEMEVEPKKPAKKGNFSYSFFV
jgi:DNA topoisomerase-2